jgi:hypothetical protein
VVIIKPLITKKVEQNCLSMVTSTKYFENLNFPGNIIQNSQKSANNFYRSTSQTRHIIINATCHPARPPARLGL